MGYRHSSQMLNYEELAAWALKRNGEVIFCEGHNGDYLPFKPLLNLKGVAGKESKELIFYKSDIQQTLQLSVF